MMLLPLAFVFVDRALPGRPRPVLDDHEPVDGRPGARDAPPGAEAAARRRSARRGRRRRRDAGYGGNGAKTEQPKPKPAQARASAAGRQAEEGGARSDRATVTVEATGETVGEAKWKALRELERLHPVARQDRRRASRCSPRASAACSASATRPPACSRASTRTSSPPSRSPPSRSTRAELGRARARRSRARRGRARDPVPDRRRRGRREPRRDLLRARPRAADRQARPDDRRDPVPRERDRLRADRRRARKEIVVDAAGYRARRRATLERGRGAERGAGAARAARRRARPDDARSSARSCTCG